MTIKHDINNEKPNYIHVYYYSIIKHMYFNYSKYPEKRINSVSKVGTWYIKYK